ncbi:hypothetical protein RRSWK_06615 [Rhodopirellula sp. SWK7]|nr:hypothetical protein RRSWK_06615 [Rhodopirellula sp. SWK7]
MQTIESFTSSQLSTGPLKPRTRHSRPASEDKPSNER